MPRFIFSFIRASLVLATLATAANANALFNISFQATEDSTPISGWIPGQQLFTGTITTDGFCTLCSITQSLGVTTNDGIDSIFFGSDAFGLSEPPDTYAESGSFALDTTTDALFGHFADGVGDVQINIGGLGPGTYSFWAEGVVFEIGTFTVTPEAPEPASVLFLGTLLIIGGGFKMKRWLGRVSGAGIRAFGTLGGVHR